MKKKIKINLKGFGKEKEKEFILKTREPFAPAQKSFKNKKKYQRKGKYKNEIIY